MMPQLGLGTWLSEKDKVADAVYHALKSGYKHLDCAWIYRNEVEVGEGMQRAIKEGLVKREDIFVTSKLWLNHYHSDSVKPQLIESMKNLQVTYLDQFLMHWPAAFFPGEENVYPMDKETGILKVDSSVDLAETWRVLEECQAEGLTKTIGVSNFRPSDLELLKNAKVTPQVNQVECHPYLPQKKLRAYMKEKNIALVAYCPFGSKGFGPSEIAAMRDPVVVSVAEELKKTPAQVLLAWGMQFGNIVIPKSVTLSRIEENLKALDFKLTDAQMEKINGITIIHRQLNISLHNKNGMFVEEDNN